MMVRASFIDSIPASQEFHQKQTDGTALALFGAVVTNTSGAAKQGIVAASGADSSAWTVERASVSGQLFPYENHSSGCLHTLGAVYDVAGPASLHGTFPPTREFHSNYTDVLCATGVAGSRIVRRREARPISFRGLPFNVIRMTTGETGWARLPSGRIIFTPYVRLSPR